jgi:hypothetical protein
MAPENAAIKDVLSRRLWGRPRRSGDRSAAGSRAGRHALRLLEALRSPAGLGLCVEPQWGVSRLLRAVPQYLAGSGTRGDRHLADDLQHGAARRQPRPGAASGLLAEIDHGPGVYLYSVCLAGELTGAAGTAEGRWCGAGLKLTQDLIGLASVRQRLRARGRRRVSVRSG